MKLTVRVLLFISISVFVVPSFAGRLVFLPKVYIAGTTKITLAHIIDRTQVDVEDLKLLESVRIGDAPTENAQVKLSSQLISSAIRKHIRQKFSEIKIPSEVVVVNQRAAFTKERVYEALIWKWQERCENCRVEIKNLVLPNVPGPLTKAPWRLDLQNRLPKGTFSEKIIFQEQTGREITYWVSGELRTYQRVPVSLRTLNPGSKLTMDDYKWEWRDVSFASDGIPAETSLATMQLRQGVAANQIIFAGALVKEKVVKRGELVQVRTGNEGWQVTMQAVTEQDGYLGDVINVRNIQTRKIISGEIVAPGEIVAR